MANLGQEYFVMHFGVGKYFYLDVQATTLYDGFENYTSKIKITSSRGQWVFNEYIFICCGWTPILPW